MLELHDYTVHPAYDQIKQMMDRLKPFGYQVFIRSVAQIAHNRDISLITEGVEKEAELDALMRLGVDGAMGYLLGEPKDSY